MLISRGLYQKLMHTNLLSRSLYQKLVICIRVYRKVHVTQILPVDWGLDPGHRVEFLGKILYSLFSLF